MDFYQEVLSPFSLTQKEKEEILLYNSKGYARGREPSFTSFPLSSEPYVKNWEGYMKKGEERGVFPVLKEHFPQLSFPIQKGMSKREYYLDAVKKRIDVEDIPEATGLGLKEAGDLQLTLHPTPAGKIPILLVSCKTDFFKLVQVFASRNEPRQFPPTMGACLITGLINVSQERREEDFFLEAVSPTPRDHFIIVSSLPYGGVPGPALGLTDEEWAHLSLHIRQVHESVHYFTRRVFGSVKNHLLDELIADYFGFLAATGSFKKEWFFRALGILPDIGDGARVNLYRGDPPLSCGAFSVVKKLVVQAAGNLEDFQEKRRPDLSLLSKQGELLLGFGSLTLLDLAAPDGRKRIEEIAFS